MDNELHDCAAWESQFRPKEQPAPPALPQTLSRNNNENRNGLTPPNAPVEFGQDGAIFDLSQCCIPDMYMNAQIASGETRGHQDWADARSLQRIIPGEDATSQVVPSGTGVRAIRLAAVSEQFLTAAPGPRPRQNGILGPSAGVNHFGPQHARRFRHPSQRQYIDNTTGRRSQEQNLITDAKAVADARTFNKARWEKEESCDGIFRLSAPWHTYLNTYSAPRNKVTTIGLQTGAFVAWPSKLSSNKLKVWGSVKQRKAAIVQLTGYFGRPNAPPGSAPSNPEQVNDLNGLGKVMRKKNDNFASTYSTINQERALKQQAEDKKKDDQTFVKIKFDHDTAEWAGYFIWPTEDMSIDEAFGNRNDLRELDPIRHRCHCFIDYDASISVIRVSAAPFLTTSAQQKAVTNAVKEIRHYVCKLIVETNKSISTFLKSFNVQTPSVPLNGMKVRLEDGAVAGATADFQIPVLTYAQNGGGGSTSIHAGKSEIQNPNETRMRLALKYVLPSLQYLRGHVRMRVNFGTFRLNKYRKPDDAYQETIDEFRCILADQNTDGVLFPSLIPIGTGAHLLDRCMAATDVLIPYESNAISLKDAKLNYSAKFEFYSADGRARVYETSFIRSQYSVDFERESKCWYYEETSNARLEIQLDYNVIDFEKCPWNLQITGHDRIEPDGISVTMRKFGDSVHLRQNLVEDILAPLTEKFDYPTGTRPRCVIETTSLRFRLARDSSYVLEVYRRDTFFPQPASLPGQRFGQPTQNVPQPESSWAASLYHQEWTNYFGENAALKLGDVVSWKPNLTDFFPQPLEATHKELASGAANFHHFWELVESVSAGLRFRGENIVKAEDPKPVANGLGEVKSPQQRNLISTSSIETPVQIRNFLTYKEYCAYWINYGWCKRNYSCKYKHEMPTDLATLSEFGLTALPRWYHQRRDGAKTRVSTQVHTASDSNDTVSNSAVSNGPASSGAFPNGAVPNGIPRNDVAPDRPRTRSSRANRIRARRSDEN